MRSNQPKQTFFSFQHLPTLFSRYPFSVAGILSGGYLLFFAFYIWLSGRIAASIATNKQQLHQIELIKGWIFVLVTGLFLFLLLFWVFQNIKPLFPQDHNVSASFHPTHIAVSLTSGYMAFVALYIWLSGKLAAYIAHDKQNLEYIELIKGMLFVLISGLLLFSLLFWAFRQLKSREETIALQHQSLLSSENLSLAGSFSLSISHDINNYLFVILGNADLLQESTHLSQAEHQQLKELQQAAQTIASITQRIMKASSRSISGQREDTDLVQLIQDTIDLAKRHKKLKSCTLQTQLPPTAHLSVYPPLCTRALLNLLLNAADATEEQGLLLVKLLPQDDHITLEVHDNGAGVSPELQERILDPFFTTKADGNGLGLLSFKLCAQQHQGSFHIGPSDLGGACFALSFPISPPLSNIPQKDGGEISTNSIV